MSHRSTHYWLWFLLFGVVAGLVALIKHNTFDSEALWLFFSGLLGLVFGAKWLNEGKLSRMYDLVIGIIFVVAGIVGIFINFGVDVFSRVSVPGALVSSTAFLGLSLALLPSLIHTVLGFTSLNHGLKSK